MSLSLTTTDTTEECKEETKNKTSFYSTPSPDQLCKRTNSTSRPIRWQHTRCQCDDDQASVTITQMNTWGNWCRRSLLTTLKKVAECSTETFVSTYQSIRRHISEDRNIQYVKTSKYSPHITLTGLWLVTNTTWSVVEYFDSRQRSFSSSKR
jgi:hypothetical protein